jgi:hypothetical protein
MTEKRSGLPLQTREAPLSSFDEDTRTADIVWTTGAKVRRFDWWEGRAYLEELSLDPAHVRMGRLESGSAPLLDSHGGWSLRGVLGVVDGASLKSKEGRATVRFSKRAEVDPIVQDVRDGIIRNVSVGYAVHKYERIAPKKEGDPWTYRAIDWEPMELSLVPIGADPKAGVRSASGEPDLNVRTFACEFIDAAPAALSERTQDMTDKVNSPAAGDTKPQPDEAAIRAARETALEEGRQAERERQAEIRKAVRSAKLDEKLADELIEKGVAVDAARAAVLTKLAEQSERSETKPGGRVETLVDETDTRRAAMADAIAHRANPGRALPEAARQYRGMRLFEMARRALEQQGYRTETMAPAEFVGVALGLPGEALGVRSLHGVSDFAIALGTTVNRTLRSAYESAPRTFTRWARQGSLADFRAATRVSVAADMRLEKVNEFGEFKRGKIVEAGESIQLATYGKVIGVTRQAIINDDLDIFGRIPQFAGRAAADFESDAVYGVLTANAAMADTVALFHATHGNLGTAGVPSETTLSEMRKMMRLQKDITGATGNGQPLNLMAKVVIVPAALETATQKLLQAVIIATKSSDTNPFNGAYELVVEPRLDANSATAWYGVADPAVIDTVEYAYLDGQQGLFMEQRVGFDVDGLEVKARLDFAAKAIDHRGMFKNAGA